MTDATQPEPEVQPADSEDATQPKKLARVLIDGQNLFGSVKEQFGYRYCNFDPLKLARAVCAQEQWDLDEVRFYSGVPSAKHRSHYHRFWKRKQTAMKADGVVPFMPELRYGTADLKCPQCNGLGMDCATCGTITQYEKVREKAVDVRLALDLVNVALRADTEVVLLFSQDQDFSEAVKEARVRTKAEGRKLVFASAYPYAIGTPSKGEVFGTKAVPFDKTLYDGAIDPNTYGLQFK